MYEPQTERIRASLLEVDGPGAIAASAEVAAMGLSLEVEGVGRLRFPLSSDSVQALVEAGGPSPFGYRDETRHDESVRRSREISGDRVRLTEAWTTRLRRGLDSVLADLGFPKEGEVDATLQKLVIYEKGGFFAPHRDTERDPGMWGTLVVVLPSEHQGGELVVGHAGASEVFDLSAAASSRRLGFVGFYADCVHEIRPVASGSRVALTFALHGPSSVASPVPGQGRAAVRAALEAFFEEEEWLVLLLDHAYTRQRFGWSELKGLDRHRVDLLRALAPELGCAGFLAFADVEEWFEYDDDEPAGESRASFGARTGAELTLSHWVDGQGGACVGTDETIEDPCIVSALPGLERHPHQIAGEPWTGNEGGSAAQWYHQAALVLIHEDCDLLDEISELRVVERVKPKTRTVIRRRKKPD